MEKYHLIGLWAQIKGALAHYRNRVGHNLELAHQINMIKKVTPPNFFFLIGKYHLNGIWTYIEGTLAHSTMAATQNATFVFDDSP